MYHFVYLTRYQFHWMDAMSTKSAVIFMFIPTELLGVLWALISLVCYGTVAPDEVLAFLFIPWLLLQVFFFVLTPILLLIGKAADTAADYARQKAANDPVFNNLPPLGQVRVARNDAQWSKILAIVGGCIVGIILMCIFPWVILMIPLYILIRGVVRHVNNKNEEIAALNANANSIINSKDTMGS